MPNQRGVARIRAKARKRRAEDEKVERGRAVALGSLKPLPCLRIAQTGIDQRDVEGRAGGELHSRDAVADVEPDRTDRRVVARAGTAREVRAVEPDVDRKRRDVAGIAEGSG